MARAAITTCRRFPRADFQGRVVLFYGKETEITESLQVSEGGMLAYSDLDLMVGDQITLHLTVDETYLRARAEVVYVLKTDKDGRTRVGLSFKSLFPEYRVVIRDLVN